MISLIRGAAIAVLALSAPALAQASAWALVEVEKRDGKWLLVATPEGGRGWLPEEAIAPLATLD